MNVRGPQVSSPTGDALRADVGRLIAPASVAIVGPSARNPAVVRNVLAAGVPAFGVHPSRVEVLGLPCVPSFADAGDAPDVAVLMVGHERIEGAFEQAAAAGLRAFVVPGLGTEAGAAAVATADRLRARAVELDAAVLGFNCMGVARPGGSAWIGTLPETFVPGHVAVIAHSGSVAEAMTTLGPRVGFSAVISSGSEAVRDVADLLGFFADDPQTEVIGLFLEAVRRPRAFVRALERCAERGKPVVCLKVGSSRAAARVALAHTGAVVGSAGVFSAVLRRYDAIEVDDVQELVATLQLLGAKRRIGGLRLGAISESGGEASLLADQAEAAGLEFASLAPALAERLRAEFPNFVTPENPLDAWAIDVPERVFPGLLELMAGSGDFDVLLAQVDLSRFRGASENAWCEMVVRSLGEIAGRCAVFPAVSSVADVDPPDDIALLARELDVPLLRGSRCTMAGLARAGRWRAATAPQPWPGEPVDLGELLGEDGPLPEHESASMLERYGVRFAERCRVATARAAGAAAAELGFPVVVKVDGPAHKSRVGGVVLNLRDEGEVIEAAERLGGAVFVARQVAGDVECLCGMVRDPQFGPVLAVGLGGVSVESRRPVVCLGPVDRDLALELIREAGLPAQARALAEVLAALSRVADEHPAISEIDVNPLILTDDGPVAVDALVVVTSGGST